VFGVFLAPVPAASQARQVVRPDASARR